MSDLTIPDKSNGLIETLVATLILFSPNFLYIFPYFRDKYYIFLFWNFAILFVLVSVLAHFKYRPLKK